MHVIKGVIGAALLSLALAAPAAASTADGQQGALVVLAGNGETNNISVSVSGTTATVTDSAGITPAGSCAPVDANTVTCTFMLRFPGLTLKTGDGDDTASLAIPAGPQPFLTTASAGPGNDRVDGSASNVSMTLNGDAGNDTVIGGPRGDFIDQNGGAIPGLVSSLSLDSTQADVGDDILTGNAGDDRLRAGDGADVVDAGAGADLIEGIRFVFSTGALGTPTFADDNAVDRIDCGANSDIQVPPAIAANGVGQDTVEIGAGDQVGLDCENITQFATCSQSSCELTAEITASGGASGSTASIAKKKGKKAKVLGKTRRKQKLRKGQTGAVNIHLQPAKVSKAVRGRTGVPATFALSLKPKKKGKTKVKRVRFKLGK